MDSSLWFSLRLSSKLREWRRFFRPGRDGNGVSSRKKGFQGKEHPGHPAQPCAVLRHGHRFTSSFSPAEAASSAALIYR